jgi:copper chaperone CopZ
MKDEKSKKLFKRIMMVFGFLTIVLAIHIYWVTRPKAPDPHTIVMARIDIKNSLNQDDANKIKTWLYQQKGVNHVMVNPKTQIAIFTFYPAKVSGDQIVNKFQTSFKYDAKRYVPTKEEIANGCPALPPSVTQKISSFIKHNL